MNLGGQFNNYEAYHGTAQNENFDTEIPNRTYTPDQLKSIHSKKVYKFAERYQLVSEWHKLKQDSPNIKLTDYARQKGIWPNAFSCWILKIDTTKPMEGQQNPRVKDDKPVKHPREEELLLQWWRNERFVYDRWPSRKDLREQMAVLVNQPKIDTNGYMIQKFCETYRVYTPGLYGPDSDLKRSRHEIVKEKTIRPEVAKIDEECYVKSTTN